jgi:YrbI family 3-deoxy-D-manno-octulosonate 8-phosphate phosphatase
MKKTIFISDVDGCLTDGRFIYTVNGKVAKIFGPHDNDGVKMLKRNNIDVVFISADKRGFAITSTRIQDMKCKVYNVSESDRVEWVKKYIADNNYERSLFFGDGIGDIPVKDVVDYFVAPKNARIEAREIAHHTTPTIRGQGAFLDAAIWFIDTLKKNNELQ